MDAKKLCRVIISSREKLLDKTRKDIFAAKVALTSLILQAVDADEVGEIQSQLQKLSESELALQEAEKQLDQLKRTWQAFL